MNIADLIEETKERCRDCCSPLGNLYIGNVETILDDLTERLAAAAPVAAHDAPQTAEQIAASYKCCAGLKPPCKVDCPCFFEAEEQANAAKP